MVAAQCRDDGGDAIRLFSLFTCSQSGPKAAAASAPCWDTLGGTSQPGTLHLPGRDEAHASAVQPPSQTWQSVISSSLEVQGSQIHEPRNVENDQPVRHLIGQKHACVVSVRRRADRTSDNRVEPPCRHRAACEPEEVTS